MRWNAGSQGSHRRLWRTSLQGRPNGKNDDERAACRNLTMDAAARFRATWEERGMESGMKRGDDSVDVGDRGRTGGRVQRIAR